MAFHCLTQSQQPFRLLSSSSWALLSPRRRLDIVSLFCALKQFVWSFWVACLWEWEIQRLPLSQAVMSQTTETEDARLVRFARMRTRVAVELANASAQCKSTFFLAVDRPLEQWELIHLAILGAGYGFTATHVRMCGEPPSKGVLFSPIADTDATKTTASLTLSASASSAIGSSLSGSSSSGSSSSGSSSSCSSSSCSSSSGSSSQTTAVDGKKSSSRRKKHKSKKQTESASLAVACAIDTWSLTAHTWREFPVFQPTKVSLERRLEARMREAYADMTRLEDAASKLPDAEVELGRAGANEIGCDIIPDASSAMILDTSDSSSSTCSNIAIDASRTKVSAANQDARLRQLLAANCWATRC